MTALQPTTLPTMPHPPAGMTPFRGWFLYDGQCSFCTRWVARFSRILRRHGFAPLALQTPGVGQALGLSPAELLSDVRVLTAAGVTHRGANAYLHVMKSIWYLYPLSLVLRLPGLNYLFRRAYRHIADNRHCLIAPVHPKGTERRPHAPPPTRVPEGRG